ncbi:MAG: DUF2946 family protein [Caldimonas sp.]
MGGRTLVCYSDPVRALRRRLRGFVWLCLIAMAGLAIAPTISRALLPEHPDSALPQAIAALHSTEDPSLQPHAAGHHVHHHAAADSAGSPPSHHQHSLDHCALCAIAASAWTLDSVLAGPVVDSFAPDTQVPTPGAPPARRLERLPATWRGPPSLA